MTMKTVNEVASMMEDAIKAALRHHTSPEDDDYKRVAVEALCEQFTGACYALAGGDPEQLENIFNEHAEKAMAVIVMVVEIIPLLPEGGVSTRDLWEQIMKAVDER
jgi:hypothetical protein